MVSSEYEQRIVELWGRRYSQRAIARELKVSRDAVRRVVQKLVGTGVTKTDPSLAPLGTIDLPQPVIRRFSLNQGYCRKCRVVVYLPCMACQIRSWLRIQPQWPVPDMEPTQVDGVGLGPYRRARRSTPNPDVIAD
jgi:hypothetical protein